MRRGVAFALVLASLTLVLAAPISAAGIFDSKSTRMVYWNGLFKQILYASIVVGIVVWGLLLYALWRFRAKKGGPTEGPRIHGNTKMEIAWTIAPAAVMAWLLIVSFHGLFQIDTIPAQPDATIRIEAAQFSWTFYYPGSTQPSGVGPQDPIYVMANKVIAFDITSKDVIHAFSVPELGLMKDANPGRVNHDWVKPTVPGNYSIRCRELCGVGHSYMLGTMVVVPEGSQPLPYGKPPVGGAASASGVPPPTGPSPTAAASNTTTATQEVPSNATKVEVVAAPGGSLTFSPTALKVPAGSPVAFSLTTQGGATVHNFFFGPRYEAGQAPDHGAVAKSRQLSQGPNGVPGDVVVFTFKSDATWEFWCNEAGHYQGMHGTIVIGKGGALDVHKPLLPGVGFAGLALGVLAVLVVLRRPR